jgi:hypothetical protein
MVHEKDYVFCPLAPTEKIFADLEGAHVLTIANQRGAGNLPPDSVVDVLDLPERDFTVSPVYSLPCL